MATYNQEWLFDHLIESLDKDKTKYRDLIIPLYNSGHRIADPDLRKFVNEFGGYTGVLENLTEDLKDLKEWTSGSKIRRIIRIIFEK